MSLQNDLSRLSELSNAMRKARAERQLKADTKKNRIALIQACERKAIDALRELIGLGAPINIINEKNPASASERTPLAVCANNGWMEGVVELLAAGAKEEDIPGLLVDEKGQPLPEGKRPALALETAAHRRQAEMLEALWGSYSEQAQRRAIKKVRDAECFLVIQKLGRGHEIERVSKIQIIKECLPGLDSAAQSTVEGIRKNQAFDALAGELGVQKSPQLLNDLWKIALGLRKPGILQGLAEKGAMPIHEKITIEREKDLGTYWAMPQWVEVKPSPTRWNPNAMETVWGPAAPTVLELGLGSAAALIEGRHPQQRQMPALKALMAIPDLAHQLGGCPIGQHYAIRGQDAEVFERMKAHGVRVEDLRDGAGRNPLHMACESDASKADLEKMARVCTEWISQRDGKEKTPVELIRDREKKDAMSVVFDKVGMRDALGGKRGAKKPAAKRARL